MIDEALLMKKLNAYAATDAGKKKMSKVISSLSKKDGHVTTAAGSKIRTEADMYEAAAKFIKLLQQNAREAGLPTSIMEHFDDLFASKLITLPSGETMMLITFGGDLHRDSLENDFFTSIGHFFEYHGIDNIVALFNNGYKADATVYGLWSSHGDWVASKPERPPLRFIQQAIADFNGNYGADYGAVAVAGADYDISP